MVEFGSSGRVIAEPRFRAWLEERRITGMIEELPWDAGPPALAVPTWLGKLAQDEMAGRYGCRNVEWWGRVVALLAADEEALSAWLAAGLLGASHSAGLLEDLAGPPLCR